MSLAIYYVTSEEEWRRRELQSSEPIGTDDEVLSALTEGRFVVDTPEFNALRIDGTRYEVR